MPSVLFSCMTNIYPKWGRSESNYVEDIYFCSKCLIITIQAFKKFFENSPIELLANGAKSVSLSLKFYAVLNFRLIIIRPNNLGYFPPSILDKKRFSWMRCCKAENCPKVVLKFENYHFPLFQKKIQRFLGMLF